MGYSIDIGQRKKGTTEVEPVTLPEAPAFNEPTDHTNSRWPSYTAWSNAMDFVGLSEVMFNKKDGLMRSHPGTFPIRKKHKKAIDKAYKEFYEKYPNCQAGYSPKIDMANGVYDDLTWPDENQWATRLEWLKFWVDWSLENCTKPVFANT